jgi:hypothetical protein
MPYLKQNSAKARELKAFGIVSGDFGGYSKSCYDSFFQKVHDHIFSSLLCGNNFYPSGEVICGGQNPSVTITYMYQSTCTKQLEPCINL